MTHIEQEGLQTGCCVEGSVHRIAERGKVLVHSTVVQSRTELQVVSDC